MVVQVDLDNEAKESVSILDDSVLPAYKDFIQQYNAKARVHLGSFASTNLGEITNLSLLVNITLANSGLLPDDSRLSTRPDLEVAISKCPDFFYRLGEVFPRLHYGFGLAICPSNFYSSENCLIAKTLTEDLKHKGIKIREGKLIHFSAFDKPMDFEQSYHGLLLKLKDLSAGELDIRDLNDFEWGVSGQGGDGVSCAFVEGRFWSTFYSKLHAYYGQDRIAVTSGEVTSQDILKRYISNIKKIRDSAIAQVHSDYVEREQLLLSNNNL